MAFLKINMQHRDTPVEHPIQPGLYNRIQCTPLGGPDRGYLDGTM